MGLKLFLFHLVGIHVFSEFSFPLIPLISSQMHIASEITVSLVRETSDKLFFERLPYYVFFHSRYLNIRKELFGLFLLRPTKRCGREWSLSAHGVINCIFLTCSGYKCYRNCPFPYSHLCLLGCILIPKYMFYLSGEQVKYYSSK
jgi:hypothetical protein